MPSCSIKECGARKNNNHPTLTLHRLPVNEILKRKWINIIGLENINPRHKICHVSGYDIQDTTAHHRPTLAAHFHNFRTQSSPFTRIKINNGYSTRAIALIIADKLLVSNIGPMITANAALMKLFIESPLSC
ncbi:unnamed protein product [Arctia plantaginis]|uniref:THAP-type domain-containing protein n=1 Tax=Arctia plantaginis TaxID=874455 RepID=A0A8S1AJ29_ARCPL|nr:unnamed protein product [Arctia plantaginis]